MGRAEKVINLSFSLTSAQSQCMSTATAYRNLQGYVALAQDFQEANVPLDLGCPKLTCWSAQSTAPPSAASLRLRGLFVQCLLSPGLSVSFFPVSLSSCKPGILLVAHRWNLCLQAWPCWCCIRKWRHYGCTGLSKLPRGGCQWGRQDWIQNMYNLHFITYCWRSRTSCLENEAVITRWKPIRCQARFWPRRRAVLAGAGLLWGSKGHALRHCAIRRELLDWVAVVFLRVSTWLWFACQIQLTCPALQPSGKAEQAELAGTAQATPVRSRVPQPNREVRIYNMFEGDMCPVITY